MLVLFDIDGTLLLTNRAGVEAMQEAGERLVGSRWNVGRTRFAGGLDPLIFRGLAADAGVEPDEDLHARFRAAYGEALARRLAEPGRSRALPGVRELLARLAREAGVAVGLLTGNYPETGTLKVRAAGLDPEAFSVAAWGTDGPTRRALPPVAIARHAERTGRRLPPELVVVIGDTVHDVDCARANGCLAVAVASGPAYTRRDLEPHAPDLLLDDLTDTERVLRWLRAVRRGGLPGPLLA